MCNTAKNELQKIRLYDTQIDRKLDELERLKAMTTKVTTTITGDVSGGAHSQDKLGDAIAKIVDLETEINTTIDAFVDMKRRFLTYIDQIEDANQVNVLYRRYFEYQSLEQIAVDMGYTYRNVCYIHGKALQAVNERLGET